MKNKFYKISWLSENQLEKLSSLQLNIASIIQYYEDQLQSSKKLNKKFFHTCQDIYSDQRQSFDNIVKTKALGTNDVLGIRWILQDLGVYSIKNTFWFTNKGKIQFSNDLWHKEDELLNKLDSIFDKIFIKDFLNCKMYIDDLQVGDIIVTELGHSFVYIGNNKIFVSGHSNNWYTDNDIISEDFDKAVFDTWIEDIDNSIYAHLPINFIWRIKDSIQANSYRNENGILSDIET